MTKVFSAALYFSQFFVLKFKCAHPLQSSLLDTFILTPSYCFLFLLYHIFARLSILFAFEEKMFFLLIIPHFFEKVKHLTRLKFKSRSFRSTLKPQTFCAKTPWIRASCFPCGAEGFFSQRSYVVFSLRAHADFFHVISFFFHFL